MSNLVNALETELEKMLAEKKALEARIFRVESFLRQEKEPIASTITSTSTVLLVGSTKKTFQERIREIIQKHPHSVRPQVIVDHLKRSGFEVQGVSSMSIRVANELARMMKHGELEKVERGIYRAVN